MSSVLDGVLKDLELACSGGAATSGSLDQNRTPQTNSSHLVVGIPKSELTSENCELRKGCSEAGLKADLAFGDPDLRQKEPPPVPQRDISSKIMATTISNNAVTNNLNELDVLLQDLSNARFSGGPSTKMMEQRSESVMTSSSMSYQSSGFYPSDYNRPRSGGSKSPLSAGVHKTPLEDAVIKEMSSKMSEMREESYVTSSSEQKWEYVGQGIWENGEKHNTTSYDRKKPISADTLNMATSYHQSSRHKASSATQELDDLMQSLNTFKLGKSEEPVSTNLDVELENLQDVLKKQGVSPLTQKGVCAACERPIVGQVVTALGKTFHPEHFTCAHCNMELGTQNFFEREGQPFCENDYQSLFSPKCAHCNGAILDKCISALDRTWHPEHFVCIDCNKPFGDEGFHEKDDQAFCKDCYYGQFAPKCAQCQIPITENYISSLGAQWHPNCFVCNTCNQPFADGNFFEHEGAAYCETHFHALKGSLCAGCSKPISGRCITAMFRKFHPEHFVCSFCLKQLNKGTFKEKGEKPYCHECFNRLFG